MLEIVIPPNELWDSKNERFIVFNGQTLQLEHSLLSLSKWESKWNKAFLTNQDKSNEEIVDYIKCMTLTKNVDPLAYEFLTRDNFIAIQQYIEAPMTATYISEDNTSKGSREVVTSELIYYWMIDQNIPSEYQKWHLNRLLTLIRVCSVKNSPPKKRSKREIMRENARINAERRKKYNTKG